MVHRRGFGVVLVALAGAVACQPAALEGSPLAFGEEPEGAATTAAESSCLTALASVDPSRLPTCAGSRGGARGRCVESAKLGVFGDKFEVASCKAAETCVPEKLMRGVLDALRGGPKLALARCKPVLGKSDADGRCFSALARDVAANYDALKGATGAQCDPDEVCTPCLNPLAGNASTGVCEDTAAITDCRAPSGAPTGGAPPPPACPYVGPPLVDVSTFAVEDCGAGMRCVPAALLPSADLAASLKKCSAGVCAPEKAIAAAGNYVPKTCVSLAGAEGRCTNESVPAVATKKASLPREGCDANEVCAPCFDPSDGSDSRACRTARCDAPTKPAVVFSGCCARQGADKGKCVPRSAVAASLQKNLGDDGGRCRAGQELCVPTEAVSQGSAYKGPPCTGKSLVGSLTGQTYTGVCLSDCLSFDFVSSLGVARGSCAAAQLCVPCKNPLTQQGTGAPGCP